MYKSLIGFLLISSVLIGVFPKLAVTAIANNTDPFISEINFRGGISSKRCIQVDKLSNYKDNTSWCGKDQWLEIHNPGNTETNLDGFSLELRNKKTINLSGQTIPANGYFIVNFTQSNFDSIIKNSDLSIYQMLYISSESDSDISKHNVTAVLKSQNKVIDSINTHPNQIDPDYLNARGKSYFRCNSTDNWQMTTTKYGNEENYATPKNADPKCAETKQTQAPIVPPAVSKVKEEIKSNSPTNSNLVTQPATKTVTISVPAKVTAIEPVKNVQVVPKFELQNVSSINLKNISLQNLDSNSIKTVNLVGSSSLSFNAVNLPANNLNIAYRYQINSLFSYYYQENLSVLNFLLLTGLVFRLIQSIDTKLFNLLHYVTRTKKRWQPNF